MSHDDWKELLNMFSNNEAYLHETNESFIYLIALPGLIRDNVEIKMYVEKDFLTILVKTKINSTFVPIRTIRIVKLLDSIKHNQEDIRVVMENGVLSIEIPKSNPIMEYTL